MNYTRFFLFVALIAYHWSPDCFGQYVEDALMLSVDEPDELQIVSDEAFDLTGHMYALDWFYGGFTVQVHGAVEIGRNVLAVPIDPDTGEPMEPRNYFASVRTVYVQGQYEVPIGINYYGVNVSYSKEVTAQPNWKVGKTYICRAKDPILHVGFSGSFTVIPEVGDDDNPTLPVPIGN